MIVKKYGIDFHSDGGALTLDCSDITDKPNPTPGKYQKTHESGWTITGMLHKDHFTWVNEFEAYHNQFGKVWGDFEYDVYADSEEGYKHFYKRHKPEAWDYEEI